MRRLRVAFLTSWYPTPESPVLGTFVQEHAKAVAKHCDVVVLHGVGTSSAGPLWRLTEEGRRELNAGLLTYRLSRRSSPLPLTNLLIDSCVVLRAIRWLSARGFRPDVIHAHIYSAGAPAVLAGRLASLPTLVTEHSSGFPTRRLPAGELRKARIAFRGARRVLPVSRFLQRALEPLAPSGAFEVVPNAFDETVFFPGRRPTEPPPVARLTFVGRLVAEKGLGILLEALARLSRAVPWSLTVVGDGPERSAYEAAIVARGLAERVRLLGTLSKAEIGERLRESDALVLPSLGETFGTVLVEAMATGLPVLASRVGAIPEIVDDETGILVGAGDADALAGGLECLLERLARFRTSAILERARRYAGESVGRRLLSVYEDCLAG
jgi:glycosyltransferase involved in cell wall biosynthesis